MRYSISGELHAAERVNFDVLIVGAGIAGLYTALNLDERLNCCILAKESVEISNSWLAQGGIAAAISTDDTPGLHFDDTLIAGAGLCDPGAVGVLVEEGPGDIRTLVKMNVPFDLNEEGVLQITREGGHRKNRIVHAGGDATGRETVKSLARLVATRGNVAFLPYFFAEIITDDKNRVTGALLMSETGEYIIADCPNIVIATGGIGQVYKTSTNPSIATGDGIAAAMRAGAEVRDLEFIQFHPTGLYNPDESGRSFLISEAVRGEGGLLKNAEGVRFMEGAHELNELAPRDIVARAIFAEMGRTGDDHVFVDITDKPRDFLASRFPTIFQECLNRGIDISKDWIPVCPVQHYLIGGITTDLHARTNIQGLYACGEAASTGVHGANRLASNSMLECLVFGRRAAEDINAVRIREGKPERDAAEMPPADLRNSVEGLAEMRAEIQQLMSDYCFVVRNEQDMLKALARISEMREYLTQGFAPGREYVVALNLATVACTILEASIARRGSVGAHYRSDS